LPSGCSSPLVAAPVTVLLKLPSTPNDVSSVPFASMRVTAMEPTKSVPNVLEMVTILPSGWCSTVTIDWEESPAENTVPLPSRPNVVSIWPGEAEAAAGSAHTIASALTTPMTTRVRAQRVMATV